MNEWMNKGVLHTHPHTWLTACSGGMGFIEWRAARFLLRCTCSLWNGYTNEWTNGRRHTSLAYLNYALWNETTLWEVHPLTLLLLTIQYQVFYKGFWELMKNYTAFLPGALLGCLNESTPFRIFVLFHRLLPAVRLLEWARNSIYSVRHFTVYSHGYPS